MNKSTNKISKIIKIIFFIIIFFVAIDTFFIEPNIFTTNTHRLDIPNWDKSLDSFKVALVSDIHLGSRYVDLEKLDKIVCDINKTNPDIVVICGDLDGKAIKNKGYTETNVANSLKNFKSKYGVYAIMGNHDYEVSEVVKNSYKKAGITLLTDNSSTIHVNGKDIRIVGLEDLWFRNSNPREVLGEDYNKIPTILLAHNPDYFPMVPNGVSLTLSGHTHGGEIAFPFVWSFTVPSEYGNRYRSGYIIEGNKHLFVSRGIATLSIGRFMSVPEIDILELYAQTHKSKVTKALSGNQKPFSPKLVITVKNFLRH